MALVLKDRVKQAAAAPGTGTITLGATATGFQSFASVGNANTTYFAIVDPVSGDWEVNYGTYTSSGTTLTRNATPLSSSAGGALVNFTGAVDVFVTYPSSRSAYQNEAGTQVVQQSFGAITATSAALTTGTITTAPVNNTDIVNKQYADAIASGIHFHEAVNLATTTALPANTYNNGTSGVGATLTGNANGALSVDSTLTTASERILVKNEAAGANNGVYTVTQVGSAGTPYILTRATDFDSVGTGVNEIDEGDFFLVTSGTANVNTAWVQQTPPPITIGTTALVFQQFSAPITYTAGTGLSESPTYTFNIANTGTAGTYGSSSFVPVFVTNAQGQVTSVTNTAIAINGSAVSGNISGSAGSVANALTLGTYLTGGTYNGSGAVTATVDATSANTASKVVARDASGNFSAGTITATFSGNTTSATNLAGGAANQIPYQTGSGATSFITAASGTNTVLSFNGSTFSWAAGTISGVPLGSNLNSLTAGTYLTGTAYNGSAAQTWTVDATSANTASKVVARDASGNFSAGTITAALNGNATTATNSTTTSQRAFSDDISTTGQGRFTGWYSGNAATGFAVEVGVSSGQGYIIPYDRNTNTYGILNISTSSTLNLNGGSAALQLSGSVVNVTGALQQGGSQVLTAANYNSYAPTLTGTGASGTWSINVTGSAGSATTLANFTATTSASGFNPDSPPTIDQIGYWTGGSSLYGYTDGGLYTSGYSTSWYHQISGDFRSGQIAVRGKNSGTWQSWYYIPTYSLNNGYSTGYLYAGIYYDANNTAYYLDPASGSNMYEVYANNWFRTYGQTGLYSQSYASHFYPQNNGRYWTITGNGSTDYGALLFKTNYESTIKGYVYWDTTGFGLLHGGGGWSVRGNLAAVGGQFYGSWFSDTDLRAPIFYDYNNTAYYGDFASTSNLNGVLTTSAVSDNNNGLRNVLPGGGSNVTGTASVSGAIVITLPTNSYPMVRFTVKVYTYDGLSFDINCGGHTSSGTWYNTFAYMGTQNRSALNVRFCYGGGQLFVYIGELGSTWSYPQVFITDVQVGYSAYSAGEWDNGWSVAYNSSSYNNISSTHTVYPPTSSGNNTNPAYASIYYDANNTGYYVDPASTSNLNTVQFAGGPTLSQSATTGSRNLQLQGAASTDIGLVGLGSNGAFGFQLYGTGSDYGFLATAWGAWDLRKTNGGALYLNNQSSYYYNTDTTYMLRVYGTADIRSPIFYDLDNTGYYLDPASSSSLYAPYAYYYRRQAAGYGYLDGGYGTQESTGTSGPIYTIGGGYVPGTTSLGNMYGVGYTIGSISGIGITSQWGFYVASGGAASHFLDSDTGTGYATGSYRAPLFYDYNNTGYYVDPASTSNLNNVQIVTLGVGTAASGTTGEIRATANITAYYSSDIKFKTNVRTIPNAIETVESIGGKLFDWNDEYIQEHGGEDGYFVQKEDFGVIAQDVQKVFPVAVRTRPDGSLAVDYEKLSALAFAAVAELSNRVKSLEARI